MQASGGYPWGGPNINYNTTWTLRILKDKNGGSLGQNQIEVTVEGSHNEFPHYEALVNGDVLYEDAPTASGPGLFNLGVFFDNFGPKSEVY